MSYNTYQDTFVIFKGRISTEVSLLAATMCSRCRRYAEVDDSSEQSNDHGKGAYFPLGICLNLLAVKIIACHRCEATAIHTAPLSDSGDTTDVADYHWYCCGLLHKCSCTTILYLRRLYVSALQDFSLSVLGPILEPNWARFPGCGRDFHYRTPVTHLDSNRAAVLAVNSK